MLWSFAVNHYSLFITTIEAGLTPETVLRGALHRVSSSNKHKPELWQALLELLQCSTDVSSSTQLKAVYRAAITECAPPDAGHTATLARFSKVGLEIDILRNIQSLVSKSQLIRAFASNH
jgi:hypothetical protein